MNNRFIFDKRITRTCAISILAVALILVLFSCAFCCADVAYSVSPDGYTNVVVKNDLDWYMGENCLNLNTVKSIVSSWNKSDDYDFDGIEPVIVAVIDSGINYNHEIFTGKYDENGVAIEGDGVGEYDVLLRDDDGEPIKYAYVKGVESQDISDVASNMHGTHVAGIVATFIHELGLEKYIKILPIKAGYASNSGASFKSTDLSVAIDKALEYGADVVNMSISGTSGSSTSYNVVTDEMTKKAVFVAAAGNNSSKEASYPAAGENCIGVMNYTVDDYGNKTLASNSNYGDFYDLCAPGTNFYSANGANNEGYKLLSGTSMATPVVSFGAALAILKDRAYCNANKGVTLKSAQDIKNDILATVKLQSVKKSNVLDNNAKYDEFSLVKLLLASDSFIEVNKSEESVGEFEQTLDNLNPIMLSAKISEFLDEQGTFEWYIRGEDGALAEKIGEGCEIEYLPTQVGEVYIVSVYNYKGEDNTDCKEVSRAICVRVDYLTLTSSQIRELQIGIRDLSGNVVLPQDIIVGKDYELFIKDLQVDALNPDTNICWYIDGELVAEGKSLKYTFGDDSEKTFCVRINSQFSNFMTVDIENVGLNAERGQNLGTLEIVSIVIGAAVLASVISVFVVLLVKKKKLGK